MRIDQFLKYTCLVKSRARAQALCRGGAVMINARPARSSSHVQEGDRLELALPERRLIIEVEQVPGGQLSRRTASGAYTIVRDEHIARDDL